MIPSTPTADTVTGHSEPGANEIHPCAGEQIQAVEDFDRQDISWLIGSPEPGSFQIFLVGQLGRCQLAPGDLDLILRGPGFGEGTR